MIVMGTVGDFVLVVVVVINCLGEKKVIFEKTHKIIIDLILGSAGNICVCTVAIRGERVFFVKSYLFIMSISIMSLNNKFL